MACQWDFFGVAANKQRPNMTGFGFAKRITIWTLYAPAVAVCVECGGIGNIQVHES